MFELSKKILTAVSFDLELFKKELSKACRRLNEAERQKLISWVKNNFDFTYWKNQYEFQA